MLAKEKLINVLLNVIIFSPKYSGGRQLFKM